jgi:Tannase-like family of unknown function (DUF6351)
MVSGGDALVRVTVKKKDVSLGSVRIELNGANITGALHADAGARTLTGLVTGLRLGENELAVDAKDKSKGKGRADADITLTNYPIQGPPPPLLATARRENKINLGTDNTRYSTCSKNETLFSAVIWIEGFFRNSSASSRAATVSK